MNNKNGLSRKLSEMAIELAKIVRDKNNHIRQMSELISKEEKLILAISQITEQLEALE